MQAYSRFNGFCLSVGGAGFPSGRSLLCWGGCAVRCGVVPFFLGYLRFLFRAVLGLEGLFSRVPFCLFSSGGLLFSRRCGSIV